MTTSTTDITTVRERNEAVWQEQAALLFAKRVDEAFAHWHEDARYEAVYPVDGLPAVVEERFVMDLAGGGQFDNRVSMRITFRDGLIAEMVEYADRRAVEELLRRLAP